VAPRSIVTFRAIATFLEAESFSQHVHAHLLALLRRQYFGSGEYALDELIAHLISLRLHLFVKGSYFLFIDLRLAQSPYDLTYVGKHAGSLTGKVDQSVSLYLGQFLYLFVGELNPGSGDNCKGPWSVPSAAVS
jgi:hypothetical protein